MLASVPARPSAAPSSFRDRAAWRDFASCVHGILLNLAFSLQAAYAAPLILLAGNRAAIRDRMTLEHAAAEADIEEKQNERLLHGDRQILDHVAKLEARIMEMETSILAGIQGTRPPAPEPE